MEEVYVIYYKKFLTKNFTVLIKNNTLSIFSKINKEVLSLESLLYQLNRTLGFKPITAYKITLDWFKTYKDGLTKQLTDFLLFYKVHLGQFKWELIDPNGEKVEITSVLNSLGEYYDNDVLLQSFFDEWFDDRMIKETERRIENG